MIRRDSVIDSDLLTGRILLQVITDPDPADLFVGRELPVHLIDLFPEILLSIPFEKAFSHISRYDLHCQTVVFLINHAFPDTFQPHDKLLQLFRRHIFPIGKDDQILDPAGYEQVAILIDPGQISRMQPSVVKYFFRFFRIVQIALKNACIVF